MGAQIRIEDLKYLLSWSWGDEFISLAELEGEVEDAIEE